MMTESEIFEIIPLLDIDPESGSIVWKGSKRHMNRASNGPYRARYITRNGERAVVVEHILIWCYVNGKLPTHEIDHINGIKTDNRISNLRDIPHKSNTRNRTEPNKNNGTSPCVGVSFSLERGKYEAYITVDRKVKHLGRYNKLEDAILARKEGERYYWKDIEPRTAAGSLD